LIPAQVANTAGGAAIAREGTIDAIKIDAANDPIRMEMRFDGAGG
jgi:hypothetical protein